MSTIHDSSGDDEEPLVEAVDIEHQADPGPGQEAEGDPEHVEAAATTRRFYANLADL
jgi:hypothetical protein